MVSGVPCLRSIAWSHILEGGNLWESSSLNNFVNWRYSAGTSALICCLFACMSSSVAAPRMVQSLASVCRIFAFSSSVCMVAMTGNCWMRRGLIELITIGKTFSWMVAVLQLSVGSYVASHG